MDTLLYYKEAKDGQILEEGITEAGSLSSFIAAGTAYATHGVNTIPFFIYYSMFGFQRVGDLIWAGGRLARPRLPARRHGGPDDAGGRGAAAPGRQQPRLLAVLSELPVLRPGLRLRARRDHPGRHQADVSRPGEHLLLPDRDERAVRDAGDARRVARRASSRGCTSSRPRPSRRRKAKLQRAAVRQRRDPQRSRQGAGDPAEVRRRRRRVERHQLRRALSRRPRVRALEHAAPDRDAEGALRHAVPEGRARRVRRRVRLLQGPAGLDRSLDAAPDPRRSAPTASAAARTAPRCASSSKSTRASSPSRRCRSCSRKGRSTPRSWRRRSRTSGSTPTSRIRRFA